MVDVVFPLPKDIMSAVMAAFNAILVAYLFTDRTKK